MQEIACVFYLAAWTILKGYSAVVQNVVGFFRNIVAIYFPKQMVIGRILVFAGLFFGIYFNNKGFLGLLPVFGSFPLAAASIMKNSSPKLLKYTLILNSLGFTVYGFVTGNVVSIVTNILTIVTTGYALLKERNASSGNAAA